MNEFLIDFSDTISLRYNLYENINKCLNEKVFEKLKYLSIYPSAMSSLSLESYEQLTQIDIKNIDSEEDVNIIGRLINLKKLTCSFLPYYKKNKLGMLSKIFPKLKKLYYFHHYLNYEFCTID